MTVCKEYISLVTVCEEYIGLMPVAQTNADIIVVCIKDVLLRMNLRIQDARGQCAMMEVRP